MWQTHFQGHDHFTSNWQQNCRQVDYPPVLLQSYIFFPYEINLFSPFPPKQCCVVNS